MKNILLLNKRTGQTPLECVEEFRKNNPEYKDVRMGYAGRLDPMANGLLLVLVGKENKKREQYLGLDKEYECEVLLGFSTDSYDLLGKTTNVCHAGLDPASHQKISNVLQSFIGKQLQQFPPYSSRTVGGERLYKIAREGRLDAVEIPSKEIEMYNIELLSITIIASAELLKTIKDRIAKVHGKFRQTEIVALWEKTLENDNKEYPVIKIRISCSSGTYMRSLANHIGKKLGSNAIALSILRTKVGNFTFKDIQ